MLSLRNINKSRNSKSPAIIVTFICLLILSVLAQSVHANGATSALVETGWLADNLNNPDIRIIHVGSNEQGFNFKHIPNSVFFNFMQLFGPQGLLGDGSAPPNKAKFEGLMSKLGVDNRSHVVVVGGAPVNNKPPFTVTVFWLMKYHGHEKVSFLNGGVTKWMKENLPTSNKPAKVNSTKYASNPDSATYADAKYVLANIKNPKTTIVDVRSADEYTGKINPMKNVRVGHIPGVGNIDYSAANLNSDGTFKTATQLKTAYEAIGVTADKEVIIYCEGGVRAANTYFALKHILGYPNVKNYVGSFGNWSKLDPSKYPVEK